MVSAVGVVTARGNASEVAEIGQPVQGGTVQALAAQHLGPVFEPQIGGDHQRLDQSYAVAFGIRESIRISSKGLLPLWPS